MKTCVCSGHDLPAVLECIEKECAAGFHPTLALIFCSVAHDFAALAHHLSKRGIAVVGATTAGEIAEAQILEEACSVLLLEAPPEAFAVHFQSVEQGDSLASLAEDLGRFAAARFAHPAVIVFVSGLQANGEEAVRGIRTGAGQDLPLFGGMAGDDLLMENTYVFSGTGATTEGLISLVLDTDRIQVVGLATNGWQPVGIEKTVTRAEGNRVYTIGNASALDVYKQYLQVEIEDDQPNSIATSIGVQYPLSVRREDGTTVIRAPMLYNAEQDALIFSGSVPQGAKVRFCIPPSWDIVERVVEEAADLREQVPHADALVLISCKARHLALGPLAEDEIQGIYDLWEAPMLGYFSYGEIGARQPRHCDFHTETCTLIALQETGD